MMGVILAILLLVVGVGAGAGAGLMLRPAAIVEPHVESSSAESEAPADEAVVDSSAVEVSYVKINNQFVVPVIKGSRVSALVVLSISLETHMVETGAIYDREPKLRDAFLQVLFDHAYQGGFDGVYTAAPAMNMLRQSLLASAQKIIGSEISDILITDIVRQDI